jgi:hypothetical protein
MRVSGQVFDPANIAMLLEVDVIEIFSIAVLKNSTGLPTSICTAPDEILLRRVAR